MSIRLIARAVAGFGLCAAALTASAGPYSGMVVFGDSLSDSGNNALLLSQLPGGLPPVNITGDDYYSKIPSSAGTYSNGKVWTQYLAQSLGVTLTPSLAGGTNYANGGAQTSADGNDVPFLPGFPYSMRYQLNNYMSNLSSHGLSADPNALYIVAGGGNNVRVALEAIGAGADPAATFASTISGYAADMAGFVGQLRAAGAQHVLVMNTPNFGLTPLAYATNSSAAATQLSYLMDQALDGALANTGVKTFDMFSYLNNAVAFGNYSDVTHACGAAVNHCDVATSLFWDGIHPTTLGHQDLANAVLATAVPEPETVALFAVGLVVVALSRRRRAGVEQG